MKNSSRFKHLLIFILIVSSTPSLAKSVKKKCESLATMFAKLLPSEPRPKSTIRYSIAEDKNVSEQEKLFLQKYILKDKTKSISKVINEIENFVGDKLYLPTDIEIILKKDNDNFFAYIYPQGKEDKAFIQAALHFSPNPYLKPEVHAHNAIAHEYGHHILHYNLYKKKNLSYQVMLSNELEIEKAETILKQLEIKNNQKKNPLNLSLKQAKSKLDKLKENDWAFYYEFVSPYDELFADVVTVMRSENGRALRDMFKYQNGPEGASKYRDFSARFHKVSDSAEALGVSHYLLTPVRSHLWERYISKLKSPSKKKGEFLKRLYEAISEELDFNIKSNRSSKSIEPNQLNQDLIKRIDQKMIDF